MATLGLLAVLVVVIGLGVSFVAHLRSKEAGAAPGSSDEFPTLSFDSQTLYRPIRAVVRAIRSTVDTSTDPAVMAMADSVREEIDSAHDRIVRALQTRDELRKATEGQPAAVAEASRLQKLRDAAESDDEKVSMSQAYQSKLSELAEYEKAKVVIRKIENEVQLTLTSLNELKAKLSVMQAGTSAPDQTDDLRASLGNLETIQSSIDEAQAMLHP